MGGEQIDERAERAHAQAVVTGIQIGRVEQDRSDSRRAGARDVDVIQIADVNRRFGAGALTFECEMKESRIRLLDANDV